MGAEQLAVHAKHKRRWGRENKENNECHVFTSHAHQLSKRCHFIPVCRAATRSMCAWPTEAPPRGAVLLGGIGLWGSHCP